MSYILIVLWTGVIAFFSTQKSYVYKNELVCGRMEKRVHPAFAFITFSPLVLWAANRGHFADTSLYISTYHRMPDHFSDISNYLSNVDKDKAFYGFAACIKCVFGNNEKIYLFIIAAIQAYFLARLYRKYSWDFAMSFFLFIISTDYISWMFNGMRQFFAVSITLFSFEFAIKKKYLPAIIIVLIASLFHQTALLVLPVIFISQGKPWNSKTIVFIIVCLFTVFFIGQFTDFLDSALEESQYSDVVSQWKYDDGTNILRVLVYSIPAIIAFLYRDKIAKANNKYLNYCTNMSIITMGIYVISIFTSGIYIGRIPIYFSLYSYILLPWEINNLFDDKMKFYLKIALVVCYLIFYYYQMHSTYGLF